MNRLFEIQTLSARQVPKRYDPDKHYLVHGYEMRKRKRSLADYGRLADPVTVITAIGTILPSLFPNLLGTERLTMQHLNVMFPSNGFYTTKYKNWLLARIKYVQDLQRDLHMYTGQFIEANPEIYGSAIGQERWAAFYKILQQEAATGGSSPVGNVYGASINYETLLLVGGGALLLFALAKKKRNRKR